MYVIATVICPNFHFSVSPHVPFLNLLFEQIANSNEYLLDEIGVDTAENEPLEVWGKIQFTIHFTPYWVYFKDTLPDEDQGCVPVTHSLSLESTSGARRSLLLSF